MPIYAYRCSVCGHAKDVLQKVSDPVLSACPACGAEAFTKQITAAGFQLKGSGWYVTDFRGNGAGKPPAAEGGDAQGGAEGGAARPAADGAAVATSDKSAEPAAKAAVQPAGKGADKAPDKAADKAPGKAPPAAPAPGT